MTSVRKAMEIDEVEAVRVVGLRVLEDADRPVDPGRPRSSLHPPTTAQAQSKTTNATYLIVNISL